MSSPGGRHWRVRPVRARRRSRSAIWLTAGIITTIAGTGTAGFSGDNGPATSAQLNYPSRITLDSVGNLYVADTFNSRVRKISNGIITTVAGNGTYGFSGDNGPATKAMLSHPTGIVLDAADNLYISDPQNNRVRRVSNGLITTVAGNGVQGMVDAVDAGSGELNGPQGLSVDAAGNVYIAEPGNNRIRLLTPLSALPVISKGGIGPLFSSIPVIQSGSWVSIYGSNLASGTTSSNAFPTSLGGTSVTVNGKAAYLAYASPGQINLQAPDDSALGAVPVVVSTAGGSATSTVTIAQFGPCFSLLDNKHVAGIILRTNGSGAFGGGSYDIIGPTGNSLGYPTVAAKAGDLVELFGTGFGPTNPAVPAGHAFAGAAATTNPVNILIGNAGTTPSFAGLSGPGLNQFNLIIPPGLGTGDISLQAVVVGMSTPSGVVISLQ